jgi:zinc protease
VGDYSIIDLNKKLTGQVATASAVISDLSEGVSGRASPKDLETMMQLTWLRLTSPRADTSAFKALLDSGWLPHLHDSYRVEAAPTGFAGHIVQAAEALGVPRATALRNLGQYQMIVECKKESPMLLIVGEGEGDSIWLLREIPN